MKNLLTNSGFLITRKSNIAQTKKGGIVVAYDAPCSPPPGQKGGGLAGILEEVPEVWR